ncbi:hypothetical protein BO99DRAFT_437238 [Aspergillus violaceofuscus CBS 115571]|uniref:Uncharacterized protein n=1 Tax=Aspergillus violaceofuscus (strain CBS 115571) TaxID=1450538 RepID=A0A2V5H195_ASPV1|nr:hypothetical protein BO99DRAFT_437238 [Aspergillus violaceofuscus CBS 115571]
MTSTRIPSILSIAFLVDDLDTTRIPNSWALVEKLDHAPDGLIRLGNILTDPSEPHRPLTTVTAAELEENYSGSYEHRQRLNDFYSRISSDRNLPPETREIPVEALVHEGNVTWALRFSIDRIADYAFRIMPTQQTVQNRLTDPAIQALLEEHDGRCTLYMVTGIKVISGLSAKGERLHSPDAGRRDALTVTVNEPGPKVIGYQMQEIVIDRGRGVQLSQQLCSEDDLYFFPGDWFRVIDKLFLREAEVEYRSGREGEVTVSVVPSPS